MRKVTVMIAEKEYEIHELPIKKAVAWRKKANIAIDELIGAFSDAADVDLSNLSKVGALVRTATAQIFGSVETIADLLFQYAPELAADRKRIENEGYESEIVDAFVEVVGLAFPFGGKLRGLMREIGSQGE